MRANGPQGALAFAVTGGFAEIGAAKVTVLAERAVPVAELTPGMVDAWVAEAREAAAKAAPEARDAADKLAQDLAALRP